MWEVHELQQPFWAKEPAVKVLATFKWRISAILYKWTFCHCDPGCSSDWSWKIIHKSS